MNIANEADITAKVLRGIKNTSSLLKLAQRKSIMTMASPGMYMYPLIMSGSIDSDAQLALAKGFQLTYAAAVATAYSLNPIMDMGKVDNASDYVKKFHNNNASLMSADIKGITSTFGIESFIDVPVEDIEVYASVKRDVPITDLAAITLEAVGSIKDSLCMESLNDEYQPYKRTVRIIEEKIDQMKKATEAIKFDDAADSFGQNINQMLNPDAVTVRQHGQNVNTTKIADGSYKRTTTSTSETTTTKEWNDTSKKWKTTRIVEKNNSGDKRDPSAQTAFNQVIKNNQLDAMEPTMVNVQLVTRGANTPTLNLTLSVKAMPRLVPSNLMINAMTEACMNSKFIFKFLKWQKGEIKTMDAIFGISKARDAATASNDKMEKRFLKQLKKRKHLNAVGKFMNNEVLPTTTIIITSYEAARIKEECHVDLEILQNAVKLLNSYYLLAFGIYDTEQGSLKILFDCDTDWGYTTITSLKSSVNKTNDLLNQNEIIKIFGRR